MKNVVMFISVMFLVVALGAIAQTQENAGSSTSDPDTVQAAATPSPAPADPEVSKTPRVYPIAAGVWYPGDPLPEKPFRYYRVRCWPGCHHNSEYGKYPDRPGNATPAQSTPENEEPKTEKASEIHN
ncbi:MAG: hypothetical protein RBT80_16895 [Candidatus Vecturithrix sp.]|jgi:hypothetical protein|nr:hypothetical protein [Candidatus Vecturithrix sp.]